MYVKYANPDKGVLDTVRVGDLIKCNYWTAPLRVKAVSENYFIMVRNCFGKALYSICDKRPSGFSRNYIKEGKPTIGLDYYIFGKFDYLNQEDIEAAIAELESGEMELSVRKSCALDTIYIKH